MPSRHILDVMKEFNFNMEDMAEALYAARDEIYDLKEEMREHSCQE